MARLRICFPFVGDSVGGSQISAAMLIGALDSARYEPRVVLHEAGPLARYMGDRGIGFETLPLAAYVGSGRGVLSHLKHIASATPPLRRHLGQRRISIVHAQDGRMNQSWVLPARLAGAKFVWHQRSMYAPSRLTRATLRLADRVVCNSEFARQGLPSEARPKAAVVDNPFDTESPPPARAEACRAVAAEVGLAADDRIVSFVGNLTAQKRPEVFLRAAASIRARSPTPVRFLLLGRDRDGLQPALAALAGELGIRDIVHFMGFRDPIAPWLAASDLLLAPEVDDAFGRTLVEAMLAGTPVVASDSGGHREIVTHQGMGLLTPPDAPPAMAEVALALLADADRCDEIAGQARAGAVARYALAAHAAAMTEIYDGLQPADG
ncbi:MAG: glycosyltransferase [Alphaproteobacteria bacterium]|nr:glycosyltransferase [Alphaproteobacteria bacterium]